jgi:L-histidine N-alpha-methyltransferase
MTVQVATRFELDVHLTPQDLRATLEQDVRTGLTSTPKTLPPKYFYDARGSELFEEITRLPEYYPTRREREILSARADEIAACTRADTLVELGSGSSEKTRLLLSALQRAGTLRRYVPVDVSETALRAAGEAIARNYPGVEVHGSVADFDRHLEQLPPGMGGAGRMVAFLGSTIGNLDPGQRRDFLASLRSGMAAGEHLLLGADLVKDPARLVAAYDDAAGVTAEFNRNVLRVLDRELHGNANPDAFDHVALWNPDAEWIEMRLRSRAAQVLQLTDLDLTVPLQAGEQIRTEISAKFRPAGVERELLDAGFRQLAWWTDAGGDFGLSLSVVT